jgi:hypothetical protein
MLERLFREVKRRTRVVGVFPNEGSAGTLAAEIALRSSERRALKRYLTMDDLEALERPTAFVTLTWLLSTRGRSRRILLPPFKVIGEILLEECAWTRWIHRQFIATSYGCHYRAGEMKCRREHQPRDRR